MTANTPDIRPARRGIGARFSASTTAAMGARHSLYSGAATQDWSNSKWRPNRTETIFSRAADAVPEGQSTATGKYEPHLKPLGGWPKRALDLVVASTAIVLALPLMLVAAFLIKVITGGPVLFAHRRIGFNGASFDCYKFRTMVKNANEVLEEYLASHPQAAEEWRETQKLKHDPRITLLGHILRKSSIDELPQLVNILRGEMSCVGPRPIVANELGRYGADADEYLKTRPGLTGLWQISGRNDVDYARRVVLDAQYVRSWSIWNDLVILAWTAIAVMRFDKAS
ncbi:MAG TPA: sugar transferase [Sinorhizobium sp.]|nr:sugar transferase [Sinorhizobium sp.]